MSVKYCMAENSTAPSLSIKMEEQNVILLFLLTTVTVCWLYWERKYFTAIWQKFKTIIFILHGCKPLSTDHPRRLSVLSLSNWEYRGEGNAYLAISLPDTRQILRLRKTVKQLTDPLIVSEKNELDAANFEKLNLEYYKILLALIGECYVQPAEHIFLRPNEINRINNIICSRRPEYRRQKSIGFTCGALLTDYAHLPLNWDKDTSQFIGPTFAIELKPKQGWIAKSQRIYHLCTYCLNQYIKLHNGETSGISQYCPMDLFSGDNLRMTYAIKCLLSTPQNNLKIFQNGVIIYGEGVQSDVNQILKCLSFTNVNEFCDLITKSLLTSLYTTESKNCTKKHLENEMIDETILNGNCNQMKKKCCMKRKRLPPNCVLNRILMLQELDEWGSSSLSKQLKNHRYATHENPYLHAMDLVRKVKENPECPKCLFEPNANTENYSSYAQQYLMSAIAKDCSLMLTYRQLKHTKHRNVPKQHIMIRDGKAYAFQINVFDLYPKPISCVEKHAKKQVQFQSVYKLISNGNQNNGAV